MKSFKFSLLLICLAFVSFGQSNLGPPDKPERTDKESQMFATADIHIAPAVVSRTLEYRPDRDGYVISTTGELRSGQTISITTAEMRNNVSDIDVGVSITKADTPVMLTPDNQRLTPNDTRLTAERSKQLNSSPTFAHTYNYLPGFVGWNR